MDRRQRPGNFAPGEALVLGPNINLPMQDEAVTSAFAAAQKAQALAATATPREQALIAAVSVRCAEDPKADRKVLDAAYAAAMAKAAEQFPDDNEIAVLYAESVMDLSPWNYWQPGGHEPNPQSAPIVPTLKRVLAKDPNHAGAIHYYIHAVEASDQPERAGILCRPAARRYSGRRSSRAHAEPYLDYYRVGRYLDALSDNKTAVAVDEKYLEATDAPMGVYRLEGRGQMLRPTAPTEVCNKRAAECERLAELAETTDGRDFYLRLAKTSRTIAERRDFPDRSQSFIGFMKEDWPTGNEVARQQ